MTDKIGTVREKRKNKVLNLEQKKTELSYFWYIDQHREEEHFFEQQFYVDFKVKCTWSSGTKKDWR